MDEKPLRAVFYPTRLALAMHNVFQGLQQSGTEKFCPWLDEKKERKPRNKSEAKIKWLEAKPFAEGAESWKRENPRLVLPALQPGVPGAKSNQYGRTQNLSNGLNGFRCLNFHYGHRWSFKASLWLKPNFETWRAIFKRFFCLKACWK